MSRLGLAALLVLFSGCCWPSTHDDTVGFTVAPDDPVHAAALQDCFADDARCLRLCQDLLGPPPIGTVRAIVECYVDNRADGLLDVHATSRLTNKCDAYGDPGWDPPPPDAVPYVPDAAILVDAGVADADPVIGDAASGP